MEEAKKLVMTFKNEGDNRVSLTIEDPKDALTEAEIKTAMELIIAKNIFKKDGYALTSAVGAKVVNTETTEYDLVL